MLKLVASCCLALSLAATLNDAGYAGLLYNNDQQWSPLPLQSVNLTARIVDWAAGLTLQFTYTLQQPAIARFVIPQDSEMTIYRLEANIDSNKRVLNFKVREKVLENSSGGELMKGCDFSEPEGDIWLPSGLDPDALWFQIGNVNRSVTVTISYTKELSFSDGGQTLNLSFPSIATPRCSEPAEEDTDDGSYVAAILCNKEAPPVFSLSASVKVSTGNKLSSFTATLPLETGLRTAKTTDSKGNTGTANLTLNSTGFFSGDLATLTVKLREPYFYSAAIEPGVLNYSLTQPLPDGNNSFSRFLYSYNQWYTLPLVATWFDSSSFVNLNSSYEYWFLLDSSTSMTDNNKYYFAQTALRYALVNMPANSKFNVIKFSTGISVLSSNSLLDSSQSQRGLVFLSTNQDALAVPSNTSGLYSALSYIYSLANAAPNTLSKRFVILATDGLIDNADEVFNLAEDGAMFDDDDNIRTRLFAFAVGSKLAGTEFLAKVTQLGKGAFVHIDAGTTRHVSDLEQNKAAAIMNLTKIGIITSGAPGLNHNCSTIDSLSSSNIPLPTRAANFAILGNSASACRGNTNFSGIQVNGRLMARNVADRSFTVPLSTKGDPTEALIFHRVAAKQKLMQLEAIYLNEGMQDGTRQEIIALSLATGITSQFTEMAATDATSPTNGVRVLRSYGVPIDRSVGYTDFYGRTVAVVEERRKRIEGRPLAENEFPWLVRLVVNATSVGKVQRCDATIISDSWLLTAAHCFDFSGSATISVYLGRHNLLASQEQGGFLLKVTQRAVRKHPDYNSSTSKSDFDIALLRLDAPLTFDRHKVRPVRLPDQICSSANDEAQSTVDSCQKAVIAGWSIRTTYADLPGRKSVTFPCQNVSSSSTIFCGEAAANQIVTPVFSVQNGSPVMCLLSSHWHLIGVTTNVNIDSVAPDATNALLPRQQYFSNRICPLLPWIRQQIGCPSLKMANPSRPEPPRRKFGQPLLTQTKSDFNAIVDLQFFNSSFPLNAALVKAINFQPTLKDVATLRGLVRQAISGYPSERLIRENDLAMGTLVAIAAFRVNHPERAEGWLYVERKAVDYLTATLLIDADDIDDIVQTIGYFLQF